MKTQTELIGAHPEKPNIFGIWLDCADVPVIRGKRHRALSKKRKIPDDKIVDFLARKLIHHHYNQYRLQKLNEQFGKIGYPKYLDNHRNLPQNDKTQKGNLTEVILLEYVTDCLNNPNLFKVLKLTYNPNVEQSMKGDDMLLIDLRDKKQLSRNKIYLGEAKFRQNPTKAIIEEIVNSLNRDKLPLSFSFLIDRLGENSNTAIYADILDKIMLEEVKGKRNLIYTGMLLSNENTFKSVEDNLNSDNLDFIFISIGIDNPSDLVDRAFTIAEYYINNLDKL